MMMQILSILFNHHYPNWFRIHVAGSGNATGGNNGGGKENQEARRSSSGGKLRETDKPRTPFLGSRWVWC